MLSQLDTVIGFVVVMSIVSLMVMIATQICSSAMGLRGKNLADALEVLFHKLAPHASADFRRRLVEFALTHSAISDSILSAHKKEGFLLRTLPLLRKWRRNWLRATAVRPDELLDLLREQAEGPFGAVIAWRNSQSMAVQSALAALGSAGDPASGAGPTAVARLNAAKAALETLDGSSAEPLPTRLRQAVAALDEARASIRSAADFAAAGPLATFAAADGSAAKMLADLDRAWNSFESEAKRRGALGVAIAAREITAAAAETAKFERWFDSTQDRAQQWFAMHARIITVVAAVAAAFFLQLDTFQLVRLLAANPEIRAKLIARADALERQAESLAQQQFSPALHRQAVVAIRAAHPEWQVPAGLDALPLGTDLADAKKWVAQQLQSPPQPYAKEAFDAYDQNVRKLQLAQNIDLYKGISADSRRSSLQLIPEPYPLVYNSRWPRDRWYAPFIPWISDGSGAYSYWSWPFHHLVGILLSAGLLSLGGPFWFSLLKQLTSLRPALAAAVDDQPKQTPASPPA